MSNLIENIKKLRELTGVGYLDCKEALKENNNDVEKSIDFLRKKGLAKASKKSSREVNEGAIGVYLNDTSAIMIEINTETDFAAKNDIFINFVEMRSKRQLEWKKNLDTLRGGPAYAKAEINPHNIPRVYSCSRLNSGTKKYRPIKMRTPSNKCVF